MDRYRHLERLAASNVGLIALAAVLVAFAGSAVHLARYGSDGGQQTVTRDGDDGTSWDQPDPRVEVGPRIGEPLGPYMRAKTERLDGFADGEVVRAVVSFDEYLRAEEVDLPDTVVVEAVQVRVPIVDVPPVQEVVEDGDVAPVVASLVAAERSALEDEERDLRTTLESDVGDLAFEEDFEQRLEELAELETVLGPDPAVVFAVVLSGTAADLRALRDHPGVRFVDPGGLQEETGSSRFYGLLPDDGVRASHGRPL